MKSFKSIREGNSVEPGVSEIDDVPEDPMSFVEIKPKKTKIVKEGIVDTAANAKVRIFSSIDRKKKELYKNAVKEDILREAVSVKKEKHSWGTMMTVHHGSDTSYPLHPEHQQAIAKLGDGEKTSFKDETNSTVHAHRDGDTVHLTRPKLSSTKTSVAHSNFNESVNEAYTEDDIAKGGTVIYKHKGHHYMSKVSHKTGGGAATKIHTTSKLGHVVSLNHVVSTDASDWNRFKNIKEETEQVDEAQMSNLEIQHAVNLHSKLKNNNPNMAHSNALKNAHISMVKKHGSSWRKKASILEDTENMVETKGVLTHRIGLTVSDPNHPMVSKRGETYQKSVRVSGPNRKAAISQAIAHHRRKGYKVFDHHYFGTVEEENMVETKGAPKGFHFTKDGKLKRGDAGQDGNGGPMLRTDPLDKQRNKVPAVSERVEQMDEKLTSKDIKMAVGVAKDKRYAGGNMSGAVKTMEKMKPGLSKHPRVQQALKTSNEGLDFKKIWESIKPEEVVIEEETFDPVAHKKEHDRLMGKHIEAHKAVSKAFADMKAQGKSPRFDIPENDKLNAIKQEIATHNAKVPRGPAPAPGSAAHYYASKKSGEYTGD